MNATKNLNEKACHARYPHKTRQNYGKIRFIILWKTKKLL